MKIYLVRHGRTRENELGILQGASIDSILTEEGRKQAAKLGKILPKESCIVFSSPLQRAKETAKIAMGEGVVIDENLIETNYGPLEGKTREENLLQAEAAGVANPTDLPGIESLESINARIGLFLSNLESFHGQYENAVIVTHSGIKGKFLRLLLSSKKATLDEALLDFDFTYIRCDNCSVSRISLDQDGRYHIESVAENSHLLWNYNKSY